MKVIVAQGFSSVKCWCVVDAFNRLGHNASLANRDDYYAASPYAADLFYCHDSGEGFDFRNQPIEKLRKTALFLSDSRFNWLQRNPGDDDTTKFISDNGGWVFQAQTPDIVRLRSKFGDSLRVSHLPFAADIYRWQDEPPEEKKYELSFVGNCYDQGRAAAIDKARQFGLYWPGPNAAFNQDAARIYRQSWVVWHASTFFNLPHDQTHVRVDWDLTMRYFEAAASGIPIVTNPIPDFERCGFVNGQQVFIYHHLDEMGDAIRRAKEKAVNGGRPYSKELRMFAEANSYEVRMKQALDVLRNNGVVNG